jgi:hypothetical protein
VRAQHRVPPRHRLPGLHHGVVHTTDDRGREAENLGYSVASPKVSGVMNRRLGLRRVEPSPCRPPPEIAPDQCVRGRGLIVSDAAARGAGWAYAAGDARYVPKMIMVSCAAVVAWAARREQFRPHRAPADCSQARKSWSPR